MKGREITDAYKKVLVLFLFLLTNISFCQETQKLSTKMLNQMGGVELWKTTVSLHIIELMRAKASPHVIRQEIWRDLSKPATKFHLKSETMNRTRASTETQGWGVLENGKTYVYSPERVNNERIAWERNFITICHKIAKENSDIIIKERENFILEIFDSNKELLCIIELDSTYAPIRWEAKVADQIEVYIYGPLKPFGKYNLPSWWTSNDGHWQYQYLSFSGSNNAPTMSFLPPKNFKIKKD